MALSAQPTANVTLTIAGHAGTDLIADSTGIDLYPHQLEHAAAGEPWRQRRTLMLPMMRWP